MSHTKEPWALSGLFQARVKGNRHDDAGCTFVADCVSDDEGDDTCPEDEANAIRIVACVNACAGSATDELLHYASHGGVEHIMSAIEARAVAAEQQRDELLATLKPFAHCATVFDDEHRGTGMPNSGVFQSWPRMYGDFELTVEDLRNARDAIAKVGATNA